MQRVPRKTYIQMFTAELSTLAKMWGGKNKHSSTDEWTYIMYALKNIILQ
jgi:hypothetical protein